MTKFRTIVADPPWRFNHRGGKSSPEHKRLFRYPTMDTESICAMGPQVLDLAAPDAHLYLWVPSALLNWGLQVVASWGFDYKTAVYWHKVTKSGLSDRGCMGFYYRNVVEPCLFASRATSSTAGRSVPNIFPAQRTGHSVKPDAFFNLVMSQSSGPYLELFARSSRPGWHAWGNEVKGVVLITTDREAIEPWREVVKKALNARGGIAPLFDIYSAARDSKKVERAVALGHKWQAQIRRTLQEHFKPFGRAVWGVA